MSNNNDESEELRRHYETLLSNGWRTLSDPKLIYTTELKKMEMPKFKSVVAILETFYRSRDHNHIRAASLLNAMFSQGTSIWIMNRSDINELLKNDSDQKFNSCDDKAYKQLLRFLFEKGIIEQLRAPSPFGTVGPRLTGVYRLIDPGLLAQLDKLVGANFRQQHEKDFMAWQMETGIEYKDVPQELTPEQEAYMEDIKIKAAEKRKKREKT